MAPKRQCYLSSWVVFDKITPGYNSSNGTAGMSEGGGGGGGGRRKTNILLETILLELKWNIARGFIVHGLYNDI